MNGNGLILRLDMVAKSFREPTGLLRVLDGMALGVCPGEIVLVQGPSGSGKNDVTPGRRVLAASGCREGGDWGQGG
jgi:predicted ABC-type transport system involved in lysophospholipase L1 biosynthesis ATPase subunit